MAHIEAFVLDRAGTFGPPLVLEHQTSVAATIDLTVPADEMWRVQCVASRFVSDATVGVRLVRLRIDDDAARLRMQSRADATQAASEDITYTFSSAGVKQEAGTVVDRNAVFGCSAFTVGPGWHIILEDENTISAGDLFDVTMGYERFNVV